MSSFAAGRAVLSTNYATNYTNNGQQILPGLRTPNKNLNCPSERSEESCFPVRVVALEMVTTAPTAYRRNRPWNPIGIQLASKFVLASVVFLFLRMFILLSHARRRTHGLLFS
jgi:hypothetical protein